ncbi:hypothetical protein AAVH_19592, partial [Aphelenchoides avenae]
TNTTIIYGTATEFASVAVKFTYTRYKSLRSLFLQVSHAANFEIDNPMYIWLKPSTSDHGVEMYYPGE